MNGVAIGENNAAAYRKRREENVVEEEERKPENIIEILMKALGSVMALGGNNGGSQAPWRNQRRRKHEGVKAGDEKLGC